LRHLKDELGPDDLVVVIFHDHGSRYVSKIFNDDWMSDRGFLTKEKPRAIDLIHAHKDRKLITVSPDEKLSSAIEKMNQFDISQMPVTNEGEFVGSLDDKTIFKSLQQNHQNRHKLVSEIMDSPYPHVNANSSVEEISELINRNNRAVIVANGNGSSHIITMYDLIEALK
jgi:cystathionine beta-synthase